MKTFETEKHNIPEGATHYFNEDHFNYFTWVAVDSFGNCCGIIEKSEVTGGIKPIPQTNIETPEEKEALDSIDSNLIKPREPSKPVITKVEWGGAGLPAIGVECWFNFKSRAPEKCTVKYIGDKICVYDDESGKEYSILLSSVEFSKLETEAEQIERERLENGQSLYELVQSLWCTVDSKYTPHPYSSPMVDDKTKEMYARLARAVDYRKESE